MGMRPREETIPPLGVIGSITAGFEIISRHVWLIVLPVLLDLLLWLGPRLSVAPLLERIVALLASQPVPDSTTARQVELAIDLLREFGAQFNLFSLLNTLPLLNVPGLLTRHAPEAGISLGEPRVLLITSLLTLIAWGAILVPGALVLGFLYLNSLARRVRAVRSSGEQASSPRKALEKGPVTGTGEEVASRALSQTALKFLRIFLFGVGLLIIGMVLFPLWAVLVGVFLAIARPLGFLVWALGTGLGSYVILHLLFVVPGVMVGGRGLLRAIWESALLIHTQFPSVLGLILVALVIYEGLGFIWSLPAGDSWTLLIGILGNGCVATGLTAALFVFYQERVGLLMGTDRTLQA
jgi:hypothetical protein